MPAPKPQVFAIMRNGHEVIRGGMTEVDQLLEEDRFDEARELWMKLHRWCDLHMKMEEGSPGDGTPAGFFKVLDQEADNAVTKNGLADHHRNLYEYEEDVNDAFVKKSWESVKASFESFQKENLSHLKEEEDIMMPVVKQLVIQGAPMKKLMKDELVAAIGTETEDWEFFVRFANEVLERHSSPTAPRVRVFDHALWAIATPEQWSVWDKWIKDTVSSKTYDSIKQAIEAFKAEQANEIAEQPPKTPEVTVQEPEKNVKSPTGTDAVASSSCCVIL